MKFAGHSSDEFKVVVFDIDPVAFTIKVNGLIEPKELRGHDSCSTGRMIALPNGQLLTYHSAFDYPEDHLQIWDTEKLVCLKEWNWRDISKPTNFDGRDFYSQIKCLPDSKHLIMVSSNGIFLFKIETLTMKEINLGKPTVGKTPHILSNGQVLSFMKHNYDNILPVMQFDLKEMCDYRKNMSAFKMSEYCVSQRFFTTNIFKDMPQDIVNHIVSYAFSAEAKAEFSCVEHDAENKHESENKKGNCIIM